VDTLTARQPEGLGRTCRPSPSGCLMSLHLNHKPKTPASLFQSIALRMDMGAWLPFIICVVPVPASITAAGLFVRALLAAPVAPVTPIPATHLRLPGRASGALCQSAVVAQRNVFFVAERARDTASVCSKLWIGFKKKDVGTKSNG
jgi:hypothetical protein